MAKVKSEEEIRAYYNFCCNMENLALCNMGQPSNQIATKTALKEICEYCGVDSFPYEWQPQTEQDFTWWAAAGKALHWVLHS